MKLNFMFSDDIAKWYNIETKKIEPEIEPCRTPQFVGFLWGEVSLVNKKLPAKPVFKSVQILWSTMSKAALRSRRTRTESSFESELMLTIVHHFNQCSFCAVVGSHARLKIYITNILLFLIKLFICSNITFSKSCQRMEILIWVSSYQNQRNPNNLFLRSALTMAIFKASGSDLHFCGWQTITLTVQFIHAPLSRQAVLVASVKSIN